MKKVILVALFLSLCSHAYAGFWPSGGPDYSKDAGNIFYCADLAGTPVTTQAGLARATPALTLYNPYGSNMNLVLIGVGLDVTSSPAAAAGFMLAYSTSTTGAPASTTPAVVASALLNLNVSTNTTTNVGQCFRIATLQSTPIAFRYLGGTTGASGIGGVVFTDQTDGQVVVPPGMTISLQATSAAAVIADFVWREDPQ